MVKTKPNTVEPRGWRKWLLGACGAAAVCGGIAWGFHYHAAHAQMAVIDGLRQQLDEGEKLPEAERRELRDKLREEIRKLPESQREAIWEQGRERFQNQMQARIKEVLAMSPAEQAVALDKQIDEFERRRKEWDARRAERERERQSGGNSGGRGDRAERGDGPGAGPPGGRPGGDQGGRPSAGSQNPNDRRRRMLANTSPEQRAEMAEYRRLMNERRRVRGLPPLTGRGGRF